MKYIFLDLETTGLDYDNARIYQLAYLIEVEGQEVLRKNIYINHDNIDVEQGAYSIYLKHKQRIEDYGVSETTALREFIKDLESVGADYGTRLKVVGYNAQFGLTFIKKMFERYGLKPFKYLNYADLDIYRVAAFVHRRLPENVLHKQTLSHLCHIYGIGIDAHDGMSDVLAVRELFKHFDEFLAKVEEQ